MEIAAVEASDDRFDTGLVFIPVHCSLHQKPGRGSATIAVVNEQAPKEYGVQVLQVEMAGQRDGACQDVGGRKSGVEGKRVSVRVDLGGRRFIKKKINDKRGRCRHYGKNPMSI